MLEQRFVTRSPRIGLNIFTHDLIDGDFQNFWS